MDGLDHICTAGFDCFHFDSKVDARDAVRQVDGRISLMGNVNNPEVLLNGTPEQATEHARYAIAADVQVVGPERAIPLRTPLENLQAIARVARDGVQHVCPIRGPRWFVPWCGRGGEWPSFTCIPLDPGSKIRYNGPGSCFSG